MPDWVRSRRQPTDGTPSREPCDSLARDPVTRFYIETGAPAARAENLLKVMQKAAQGQIGDLRKSLQFGAMVAPFLPGIGTGVAALAAANAPATGQPITDALIATARNALPSGATPPATER